jgi:hypothetical protein
VPAIDRKGGSAIDDVKLDEERAFAAEIDEIRRFNRGLTAT